MKRFARSSIRDTKTGARAEMKMDLKTVLKSNPFSDEIITKWSNKLSRMAQDGVDDILTDDVLFALEDDVEVIKGRLNRKNEKERIHAGFIPQPFIGHPEAKIWLLNINPSWFDTDIAAMLTVKQANFDAGADEIRSGGLQARQKLMLDQLRLEGKSVTFFPLNECFSTLHSPDAGGKDSMYNWWSKCVLGGGKEKFPFAKYLQYKSLELLGRSLFVLEMSPYRSKAPDKTFVKERIKHSAYGKFWSKLVEYGMSQEDKTIILRAEKDRSKNSLLRLLVDQVVPLHQRKAKVCWLKSCRNVTLSNDNIDDGSFALDVRQAIAEAQK